MGFQPGALGSRRRHRQAINGIGPRAIRVGPYAFKDAETLIDDFWNEVERVPGERGIGTFVVGVEEGRKSK
jgi:hypothetical protein